MYCMCVYTQYIQYVYVLHVCIHTVYMYCTKVVTEDKSS